jgi:hypothetical protein
MERPARGAIACRVILLAALLRHPSRARMTPIDVRPNPSNLQQGVVLAVQKYVADALKRHADVTNFVYCPQTFAAPAGINL